MPTDLISLRKNQLFHQIFQAKELGNQDQLFWLRSQLVHRYGIESLSETNQEEINHFEDEVLAETNQEEIAHFADEVLDHSLSMKEDNSIEDIETLNNDQLFSTNEDENTRELLDHVVIPDEAALIEEEPEDFSTVIAPPPIPSLNHFRRWVPSIDMQLPKAS